MEENKAKKIRNQKKKGRRSLREVRGRKEDGKEKKKRRKDKS